MPELRLAICDNCGRKQEYEWFVPLRPGWRALRSRAGIVRDIEDTGDKLFCSLRCTAQWATKRAEIEEPQETPATAPESAEKDELINAILTPEFAAEFLADPVGVRERIRKNAECRVSEATN